MNINALKSKIVAPRKKKIGNIKAPGKKKLGKFVAECMCNRYTYKVSKNLSWNIKRLN